MLGTGTCRPRDSHARQVVGVLVCTVAPLYPRTLVRYAGTCMFASLQWGRCARCPLPIAQDIGFLGFGSCSCPRLSPLWPGALGDCDCSDTVKRTQSIHPSHPTVTTVTQSRRKRNRFRALETARVLDLKRFSLGVLFSLPGVFGSFVTIASCDSAAQLIGASWPAIAFAQRLQCHSAPKPQGAEEKKKNSAPGLSGTGT